MGDVGVERRVSRRRLIQKNALAGRGAGGHATPLWTRDFILLSLANLAVFTGFQMLMPTLPVFVHELTGSDAAIGVVVGIFTVSAVSTRPWVGRELDRRGRKIPLLLGLVVFAAAAALYNAAASIAALLFFRIVHGAGWGTTSTAAGTLAADIIPAARRAEGMGYYGLAGNLAMAVAPALGLYIIGVSGFSTLFWSSAGLGVLAAALVAAINEDFARDGEAGVSEPRRSRRQVLAELFEPSAFAPGGLMFLVTLTYGSIISFLSLYAAEKGIANIGPFFSVYAVVLMLTRPLAGIIADKKGMGFVVVPGLISVAVAMLLLGAAGTIWGMLVAAVFYAAGFGAVQPALQALTVHLAPTNRRGAANATFFSSFDLGIGLGAFGFGLVAQHWGYATMYYVASLPAVVALVLFTRIIARKREAVAGESS